MRTAAATIAICSGVAATSYPPIELSPVWGTSSSSGKRLATDGMSDSGRVPKPNFSACSRRASAPSLTPSRAKPALHDRARARAIVWLSPQLEYSVVLVPGSLNDEVSRMLSGSYPASRAAADTITLNVDPGGKISRTARFDIGLFLVSVVRAVQALRASARSWVARSLGS